MPHHDQFKKSLRQNEKSRLRNKISKTRLATVVKKVMTASTKEEAQAALQQAISVIDSTARRGIIKKTTAARKKSRLTKMVNRMAQ